MITMHAGPRQADRRMDAQTDEYHGNSATIHSNECKIYDITYKK